ncbi:MAG TPA: cyclodeaminase/cyclohydrolase family protein [Chloroflexota bacterium]|nr:cyclodeaminase/cyclohydrolase family protein [Chloroflexota bacterium]
MSEQPTHRQFSDEPVRTFLDALSSSAPTPGGGAAAALVGAMAAALVSMVCNLTIGRPRYHAVESTLRAVLTQSERSRQRLATLADDDASAYAAVASAYRLPRSDESERAARTAAIQQALIQAAAPPLAVLTECRSLLPLCLQVAAHGNAAVVSDAGVAAELATAGVRSSILNVRVNLAEIKDQGFVARGEGDIAAVESGLQEELDRVVGIVRAKLAPKGTP